MFCTDKDLGLIILYADNNDKVKYYIDNDEYTPALAIDSEYDEFKTFSNDCLDFFIENFKFIKYDKNATTSHRHSNKFNLYFESDEESIMYWCMKYKIIS